MSNLILECPTCGELTHRDSDIPFGATQCQFCGHWMTSADSLDYTDLVERFNKMLSRPNVMFFWTGVARAGHWVGTRGNYFLIQYSDYNHPVESIAILPYNPILDGMPWNDAVAYTNKRMEENYE